MASSQAPSIFTYHDYRLFLRDWLDHLQKEQPGFSLRRLAREAKIAIGYLPMVLSGSRELSRAMFDKIAPHLGLNEEELMHLEHLRDLSEASTSESRSAVLARLQKKRVYRSSNPKEFETFNYMSRWYYVVIRELAGSKEFKLDARWIQSRLREKVPLAEISKAMEFLVKHDFIRMVNGKAIFPEKNFECMGDVYQVVVRQFYKDMLNLIREALDKVSLDERHIVSHTSALPIDRLPEVKAIINEAHEKIRKIGLEVSEGDEVYYITMAAVPMTKANKKD